MRLPRVPQSELDKAGGSLSRYYCQKRVSEEEHQLWMSGKKRPVVTLCPCHSAEVILLYQPWRRKKRFYWLKDRMGKVVWDGSPYVKKGMKPHLNNKLVRMMTAAERYEMTAQALAPLYEEGLPPQRFDFPKVVRYVKVEETMAIREKEAEKVQAALAKLKVIA